MAYSKRYKKGSRSSDARRRVKSKSGTGYRLKAASRYIKNRRRKKALKSQKVFNMRRITEKINECISELDEKDEYSPEVGSAISMLEGAKELLQSHARRVSVE